MNVALVLILGIATTGVIGLLTGSISLFDWLGSMAQESPEWANSSSSP